MYKRVCVSVLLSPQAKRSLNSLVIQETHANNFPFKDVSFWKTKRVELSMK